jgi:hypothetical protein
MQTQMFFQIEFAGTFIRNMTTKFHMPTLAPVAHYLLA